MKSFLKTSSNGQYNLAKELTQFFFCILYHFALKFLKGAFAKNEKGHSTDLGRIGIEQNFV